MALVGKFSSDYTKTGNSGLARFSNKISAIPFVGGFLSWPLGMIDTAVESGKWLLRGKLLSAGTALAAGTVGNTVNAVSSLTSITPLGLVGGGATWWLGNAGSGIVTGKSLGTHARKLTESALGGITGAVGKKPQVLQSYQAGIGSIGGGAAPRGPGRFVSQVAASRGEDPNAAYARLQSNEADHMAALQSAQGAGYSRGM